jgi:site-specific DNA recombinase
MDDGPVSRQRDFAFRGLLHCVYDHCLVTAELHKNRYIYYRCTGSRGKYPLPYFREEELGDRLGRILKNIHIPEAVLTQLEQSLLSDKGEHEAHRKQQGERLQQRLEVVRHRLEQAYSDKLDGKITEDFWARRPANWRQEEEQILLAMQALEQAGPDRIGKVSRP